MRRDCIKNPRKRVFFVFIHKQKQTDPSLPTSAKKSIDTIIYNLLYYSKLIINVGVLAKLNSSMIKKQPKEQGRANAAFLSMINYLGISSLQVWGSTWRKTRRYPNFLSKTIGDREGIGIIKKITKLAQQRGITTLTSGKTIRFDTLQLVQFGTTK